jgi:hypothetical protein
MPKLNFVELSSMGAADSEKNRHLVKIIQLFARMVKVLYGLPSLD